MKTLGFKLPSSSSAAVNLVFFIIFSTRSSWAGQSTESKDDMLPTIIEAQVPIQDSRSARQFLTRNAVAPKQNPEELVSGEIDQYLFFNT